MGDDRNRILELLATGKITAEEAARLLDALEGAATQTAGVEGEGGGAAAVSAAGAGAEAGPASEAGAKSGWTKIFGAGAKTSERTATGGTSGAPKFLLVKVLSTKGDNVNVKIPLALVRAGLKLTSLIPPQAQDQINKTMAEKGMHFDLSNFKPVDLEELIEALREMEVDVDSANGDKVKVYAA